MSDKVMKKVVNGQLAAQLYKYRSLSDGSKEYTLDIFRKCELYFSAPNSFNDPFDCKIRPIVKSREQLAKNIAKRHSLPYNNDEVENAVKDDPTIETRLIKAVDDVKNTHGICCFSERFSDILMWAHYADCHKGICLGFDVTEDPAFFDYIQNVIYQDTYPLLDLSVVDGIKKYLNALLKTKYSEWAYEKEVRVYKKEHKAYSFNPAALTSIFFGCKTDDTMIEEVKQVVRDNEYLRHVKFYKAVMDSNAFKLNFEELD